ncbi:MAG: hypothetical protein CL857_02455 [Cryomorphaceae bacterium]|nr:hypothetical protein [Cryomorphaceae bacterium]
MEITNNHKLPKSFVDFARNDKYSKGNADISVTTLIDSPRVRLMRDHFSNQRTVDAVDMIWPLFGTAVHHILESSGSSEDVILEERLFSEVDGWVLSGAVDHQKVDRSNVSITDYKVTSVWSVIYGKIEWERQLNLYAYLVQKNKGKKVNSLQICAILRDWNSREAKYKQDYPSAPVVLVDIPVWDEETRINYIKERIGIHQEAQKMYDAEGEFPFCSDDETWKRSDAWAVKKKGLKRAMRVFDNEEKAIEFSVMQSASTEIEYRAGESVRCNGNYCGVADFCSQHRGVFNGRF